MTIRRCLSLLVACLTGTLLQLAALATPSVPAATAFSACSTNPCYGGIEQAGVPGMILPRGPLAVGTHGELYAQSGCCDVARLSPAGAVLARWHIVSHSAPATIQAIAVDRRGNLYATDALKLRIDRLSPSGKALSPWGGFGSGPGRFELPEGIAADAAGHIYVADLKRIEKLSPSGKP